MLAAGRSRAAPARDGQLLGALAVFGAYLADFYGIWIALGIDDENIGDSASTLARWFVAPLAGSAGAGLLGLVAAVLFESERAGPRWFWLSPALTLAIAILFLLVGDFPESGRMLLLLLVGSLGVTGGEFGVEGSIVAVVSWTAVALAAHVYFRRAQAAPSSTATSATADEQSQPQPD